MRNTVLIVDDEPMVLSALKRELTTWLKAMDIGIESANSVDEALALIQAAPDRFAVVVSDLKMPQKKGTVLLRAIKDEYPDISAILLTGFSEVEEIKDAIRSGIMSFIQKPWDENLLKAEITRGIELSQLRDERNKYIGQIEHELAWTKRINQSLLMASTREFSGLSVGVVYKPHSGSACGGDFIQIIEVRNDELVVCLGDVAIHGVQGTYFALLVRDELKSVLASHGNAQISPARILEIINNRIVQQNIELPAAFMNLNIFSLRSDHTQITYASAGGEHFYLLHAGHAEAHLIPSPGIGYHADIVFHERQLEFHAADTLVLASDGVSPAIDSPQGQALLSSSGEVEKPAQQSAEMLMSGLSNIQPFTDDASVIVIRKTYV